MAKSPSIASMIELEASVSFDTKDIQNLANTVKGFTESFKDVRLGFDSNSIRNMNKTVDAYRQGMLLANEQFEKTGLSGLGKIFRTRQKQQQLFHTKIREAQAAYHDAANTHSDKERQQAIKLAEERITFVKEQMSISEKRLKKELETAEEIKNIVEETLRIEKERDSLFGSDKSGVSGAAGKGVKLVADAGDFAKTFADALDSGDVVGAFQHLATSFGKTLTTKLAKINITSGKGLAAGGVLSKLGPALIKIGAIVGSLAAVVKLLVDADSQAKEFNEAILQGAGVSDLMVGNVEKLGKELETVRSFATQVGHNLTWGTTAKDQIEILNAFTQAGHTFREMAGHLGEASDKMAAYTKHTEVALTYSRLLGISANTIATDMADMMDELGVSIDGIRDRFAAVYDASQLSGFSTKRFYGTIQEATSGMALYNIRITEAAGMLVKLGKILGKKVAPEFLRSINDMFKSDDITTRYKKVLLAGRKNTASIFAKSAENTANDFISKFGKKLATVSDIMKEVGVDTSALSNPKTQGDATGQLVQSLGKMSAAQQAKFIAKIGSRDADMARQLETLIRISKGATGKTAEMVMAMDSLDLGGKMQFALQQAASIFKKPVHELGTLQLAAFQNMTGMSADQVKMLRRVSRRMDGNFTVLQDQANKLNELNQISQSGDPKVRNKALSDISKLMAQNNMYAKSMGLSVEKGADGTYKLFRASVSKDGSLNVDKTKAITTKQDYVQSQGKIFDKMANKLVPEQLQLARESAKSQRSMLHTMKLGMQYFLEKIYQGVSTIVEWLPWKGGLDKDERKRKAELVQEQQKKISSHRGLQQSVLRRKGDLEIRLKDNKMGDKERTKVQAELEKVNQQANSLDVRGKELESNLQQLQNIKDTKSWKSWIPGWSQSKGAFLNRAKDATASQMSASFHGREDYQQALAVETEKKKMEKARQMALLHAGPGQQPTAISTHDIKLSAKEKKDVRTTAARKILEKHLQVSEQAKMEQIKMLQEQKSTKKVIEQSPEKTGKAVVEAQQQQKRKEMLDLIQSTGKYKISDRDAQIYQSTGKMTEAMAQALSQKFSITDPASQNKEQHNFFSAIGKYGNFGGAGLLQTSNDFLLRVSNNGRVQVLNRFSPQDTLSVVGHRPGGGIDTASQQNPSGRIGVGGPVNINLTINGDARESYAALIKVFKMAGLT